MSKQLELFENEGYIQGFSPRDKAIREERERNAAERERQERASAVQKRASTAQRVVGGISYHFGNDDQADRLYRLLSSGGKYGAIDIVGALRIADPRSVVRRLRNMGVNVADEWRKSNGKRYKLYWIEH